MYSLPTNTTDNQIKLSEIQVTYNSCIVPRHIFNDSLQSELMFVTKFTDNYVIFPKRYFSKIQLLRERSYRSCIWFPQINGIVPCTESKLVAVSNINDIKRVLELNIPYYPMVKLCSKSTNKFYNNHREAIRDFTYSGIPAEILLPPYCDGCPSKHLFFVKRKSYYWKVKCFWSQEKLTAVSLPDLTHLSKTEQDEIIKFFEIYGSYLPYHSCIADIGKTDNGLEIIDINNFGPDVSNNTGNFDWNRDHHLLMSSPAPVFL